MDTNKRDIELLKKILDAICRIDDPTIRKRLMAPLVAVVDKLRYEVLHSH